MREMCRDEFVWIGVIIGSTKALRMKQVDFIES